MFHMQLCMKAINITVVAVGLLQKIIYPLRVLHVKTLLAQSFLKSSWDQNDIFKESFASHVDVHEGMSLLETIQFYMNRKRLTTEKM